MGKSAKVIIADDHPLFRTALTQAVLQAFGTSKVLEAGTLDDLQALLEKETAADLLLLDLQMPGTFGYSGLIFMREKYPELPLVIVSGNETPKTIHHCIAYGASGFIPKSLSLPEMAAALKAVEAGEIWIPAFAQNNHHEVDLGQQELARILGSLTPQQYRVLSYMSQGLLNKQIAYEMDLSISSIKAYMTAILKKFGMFRRTQIVAAMKQLDLDELKQ